MHNTSTPDEAIRALVLQGNAPNGLTFNGHLNLAGHPSLTTLPANLHVKRLTLDGCTNLRALPEGLVCYELSAQRSGLVTLPADLQVDYRIDLSSCEHLELLPDGLRTGSLVLRNCGKLKSLPNRLDVYFLDASGCILLENLPEKASVRIGKLNARGCVNLRVLPDWLTILSQLDVRGCSNLTALPEGLRITSWLDLADTQITALPASLTGVRLRWRDVFVYEHIVFHPETITADEILNERNAERRRVMLDRKGYDAFMLEAHAEILNQDEDPGGIRRLMQVSIPGDEPLVCLAVYCPSTTRQYLLRVPPTITSCQQAAAWIAGFDDPADYHPLAET